MFLDEAVPLLREFDFCLQELPKQVDKTKLLNRVLRITHNLKGSSQAVDFDELGRFIHELESLLLHLKAQSGMISVPAMELLFVIQKHILSVMISLREDFEFRCDHSALINQIKWAIFSGDTSGVSTPKVTSDTLAAVACSTDFKESTKPVPDNQTNDVTSIRQTFQKMQRIVQDTASTLGRNVDFSFSGENTLVARKILEQLGDPLLHLIRNAVDHGIEIPSLRGENGKPAVGTIRLTAIYSGDDLVIEVADDGAGIDGRKLVRLAVEKGILPTGTVMKTAEALQLIFEPGFSTKSEVTEISGRGIGMDVVKTNIEGLGGKIEIETRIGYGTTFRILLPDHRQLKRAA